MTQHEYRPTIVSSCACILDDVLGDMAQKRTSRKANGKAQKPDPDEIRLPIEHVVAEEYVTSQFSNHMVVQAGAHECYLSFFEIVPPILLETQKEALKDIKGVNAVCVGRITIPSGRLPDLISALQSSLEKQKLAAGD